MEIVALVATVLIFIYLLRRNLAANKRADAAFNVLLAKHMYSRMSAEDRARVEGRAGELMGQRGMSPPFSGEIDRYGWYALAMDELGMAHDAKSLKGWKKVANPSTAIGARDPLLATAAYFLKKKYGIEVAVA